MINLKYLDLVNARRSSTGSYMGMKQTMMNDDVHGTENCRGPDTEISTPSIPTPNIDALALSLGVPISSEPTNLDLAIEAEVRWRNEMGSIPMVLEVV
jgi:hypothetical protein